MTVTLSPLDRIRNRPPNTGSRTFAFDPNDAAAIHDAEAALRDAELDAERRPQSKTAKSAETKARAALRRAVDDCVTVTITLRSIGVAAFEQLRHDHPATPEQLEGFGEDDDTTGAINPDTYAPALLAASLVSLVISDDPDHPVTEISVEDAAALWKSLTQFDQIEITGMATMLNGRSSRVDASGKG